MAYGVGADEKCLDQAGTELADTKATLAVTQAELADTKAKLADTEAKLTETEHKAEKLRKELKELHGSQPEAVQKLWTFINPDITDMLQRSAKHQEKISKASDEGDYFGLLRLHHDYRPDEVEDPCGSKKFDVTSVAADAKDVRSLQQKAEEDGRTATELAEACQATIERLQQMFDGLAIDENVEVADSVRKEKVKRTTDLSESLAENAAKDHRKQGKVKLLAGHLQYLQQHKSQAEVTDFEKKMAQDPAVLSLVRAHRIGLRESTVVDDVCPALNNPTAVWSLLQEAKDIFAQLNSPKETLQSLLEFAQTSPDKVDGFIAALKRSLDTAEKLDAELAVLIQEELLMDECSKSDEVKRLLTELRLASLQHEDSYVNLKVHKLQKEQLEAFIETTRARWAEVAALEPVARADFQALATRVTEAIGIVNPMVQEAVAKNVNLVRPLVMSQALNIQSGIYVLTRVTQDQAEEKKTLDKEKKDIASRMKDLDGQFGTAVDDEVSDLIDKQDDNQERLDFFTKKQERTELAQAQADEYWKKLTSLPEMGASIEEETAKRGAGQIAKDCYEQFCLWSNDAGRHALPAPPPPPSGSEEAASAAASSALATQDPNNLEAMLFASEQWKNMEKNMQHLSTKMNVMTRSAQQGQGQGQED